MAFNLIDRGAIWVGDHITAPIRLARFEDSTGLSAKIVKKVVWRVAGEGHMPKRKFIWKIKPLTPRPIDK